MLEPMGLLDGIKELGIEDLTEKEIAYLIRVLAKPELEGAIVMHEFLQIMENMGLYDDQPPMDGMDDEMDGDMDGMDGMDGDMSSARGAAEESSKAATGGQKKKKKDKQLDLSKLDQKSIQIMVMLMMELL